MDQAVHPCIKLGEGDPLGAAYKGLIIGMQKGIPVHNIGERSSAIAAQFL